MLRRLFILSGFLALFLTLSHEAWAIFELTVAPRQGGRNIQFESVKPGELARNEEVSVAVETDEAAQYRISQALYQPLTSQFGDTIPQNAFVVFSPSNTLGTLRAQLETPITMGESPVYTSNAAGDSDSFLLVFNVRVPEGQPGGLYRTQIQFTAQPVTGGSTAPRIVNLNVTVDVRSEFKISIRSASGGQALSFPRISKESLTSKALLTVEMDGSLGSTYRLIQRLEEPFISQDGQIMDETFISYILGGNTKGSIESGSVTPLSMSQSLLYTSGQEGSADSFQIQYVASPPSGQKSGVYRSRLSFQVESGSPSLLPQPINVPVQIEIEPILHLDIKMEEGTRISFGKFKEQGDARQRTVKLAVHSNLGQPYQVSQILSRDLTNPEGTTIPSGNFTYYGEGAQTGSIRAQSPFPVQSGESVIFISDSSGTPETLNLYYSLNLPGGVKSGDYSSDIKYSITTL